MTMIEQYPEFVHIQQISKKFNADIHLVGGFLRDYLLNRSSCDFDFAVSKDALKIAKEFADTIKGAFILLDEDFECARVVKKKKGIPQVYDFANYRADSLENDLALRDFTINTLTLNIRTLNEKTELDDKIEDIKRARKDIQSGRIKRISVRAFRDDPLRMMRAFSLHANLGFRIELSTLNQIRKDKKLLNHVSAERIREELFKVLESSRTAETIKKMDKIGLLEVIMPQISVMFDCTQGGYHHLDVWPHSIEAVVQFEKLIKELKDKKELQDYLSETIGGGHSRRAIIKFALLLHDIGKPDTKQKDGARFRFHAHEHVGASITKSIAKMLKISVKERYALEDMVRWHLRPGYISNFKTASKKMMYRYFRDTKDEAAAIALLSMADQRATRGPLTSDHDQQHHAQICSLLIDEYFINKNKTPIIPLINGDDLIKNLKLKPSALFATILNEVNEAQSLGKIKTKKEALEMANKMSKKDGVKNA